MRILSPEEIRDAENKANEKGLSFYLMMENAGKGCAEKIAGLTDKSGSAVILCGKGKNGGDGFVIARYLHSYGYNVTVIRMFDEIAAPLAAQMASVLPNEITELNYLVNRFDSLKVISEADVIIDAVFGIGFSGSLPEYLGELFSNFASFKAVKFAVDIPSGLSVSVPGCRDCYKADYTLSMLCYKKEHIYMPWREYCGKTEIIPIGFEPDGAGILFSYTKEELRTVMPPRPYNSHKGTFGHALITAGSRRMPGAAIISAKGALCSGAGLVTLAFPDCCYNAVTSQLTENIMLPLETAADGSISKDDIGTIIDGMGKYTAIAAGCGMTTSSDTESVITTLIKKYPGTLIIDADGINVLARNINILKKANGNILITPHPAEMSRITGKSVKEINSDRVKTAENFAKEYGVTVLLKGVNTVVASPFGRIYINQTGSPALSRGGSGDLLTGIITSLAAQGEPAFEAACIGSYIHGLAGMIADRKFTSFASTVERITDCIPEAFLQICGTEK